MVWLIEMLRAEGVGAVWSVLLTIIRLSKLLVEIS